MMMRDFVIPLDNDELYQTHFRDYGHRDVVPLQMISREISAISQQQLTDKGPVEVVNNKLDLLLSIVIHGNKIDIKVLLRAFSRISKVVQNLIGYLEKVAEKSQELDVEQDEKSKLLNTNKILAYVYSSVLCIIEEQIADSCDNVDNIGRSKKNVQKSGVEEEWETQREKAMETLQRWLQLPLKHLYTPPIMEDSFVETVSQICYKILEKTKDIKSNNLRNLIFQILSTLVKKYNYGIACVVRIVQLAKFYETLAVPIGTGVAIMVTECGCTGLIRKIAREIGESEPRENNARNLCNFLEAIATTKAEIVLPILYNIMDYLDNQNYIMRNCAIGVIGVIITNVLTSEDLTPEKRTLRDECLDNLEDHILDSNAYVRSKVLQTWQKLCCEGAIPLSRQNRLLKASVLRLEDKSANVRKEALQLLRAILKRNPFASKMNPKKIAQNLQKAKAELKQLQTNIYHPVDQIQLHQIKVKKKLVDYLQNCYNFSIELEKTIPIMEMLLYSVNPGDATEACSFLGAAYQFQIAGALAGLRKARFQIFCRDQSVRDNLALVYKEIYLSKKLFI